MPLDVQDSLDTAGEQLEASGQVIEPEIRGLRGRGHVYAFPPLPVAPPLPSTSRRRARPRRRPRDWAAAAGADGP